MAEKKGFFEKMAEFFFVIYLTSVYLFNTNSEMVRYSNMIFIPFAGFCVLYILQRKSVTLNKEILLVYVCFTWIFASYTWALNQRTALTNIKTVWQIFIMFFLIYNLFAGKKYAHEFFLKSLFFAGIVLILSSIRAYGITGALNQLNSTHQVRLGDEVGQVNVFGTQHSMTFIVAFYYLLYKNKHKMFLLCVMALSFLYAMASGSRKALLMVVMGMLLLVFKKYGIRRVYKIIFVTAVLLVVFSMAIQLPFFSTVNKRMEGLVSSLTGGEGDGSSETRFNMIKDGWEVFKDRILTGYGANNYLWATGYGKYAHNNFIEILVDFGIIGFWIYYSIYLKAFKNLSKIKTDEGKAIFCVFMVKFFMEMAMVSYSSKITWIMMAFFLMKSPDNEISIEGETTYDCIAEKIEKSDS